MISIETTRGEIARIENLLTLARGKVETLRREMHEARDERIDVVAGNIEGDAGICWTNEERLEARLVDAHERVEKLEDELHDCHRVLNRFA